jgi:spermidine/putrescine transport system permease protein
MRAALAVLRGRGAVQAGRWPGTGFVAACFFAYCYVPIGVLVALSFNESSTATIWTGFTTDWYGVAFRNEDMLRAARNSLVIATSASLAATALATVAAVGMARRRFRGQTAVNALIALPLTVPEIVTAVATLMFFAIVGIRLGIGNVIIAHIVFCIPFAYLPIRARIDGLDPALGEAAGDLYATPVQAFRLVTLPLLWPGVFAGAALSFIISLDDFVITFFVGGAGSTTLPIYIFGLIRIGVTPEVNAISSMMLIISVVFVTLSFVLGFRQK